MKVAYWEVQRYLRDENGKPTVLRTVAVFDSEEQAKDWPWAEGEIVRGVPVQVERFGGDER